MNKQTKNNSAIRFISEMDEYDFKTTGEWLVEMLGTLYFMLYDRADSEIRAYEIFEKLCNSKNIDDSYEIINAENLS